MKRTAAILILTCFLFCVSSCTTLHKHFGLLDESTQKQILDKRSGDMILMTSAGVGLGAAVGLGGGLLSRDKTAVWMMPAIIGVLGGFWQYYMTNTRWSEEEKIKEELYKMDKKLYDEWKNKIYMEGKK